MRPLCVLALLLALPSLLLAAPRTTLHVERFPQRLSDRYSAADGLAGRVLSIRVDDAGVTVVTQAGPAVLREGKWVAGPSRNSRTPEVDPKKLPEGAAVLSTARGAEGRVWVVTSKGLFRSERDRFVPVPFPRAYLTNQKPVNTDARLTCVAVDGNSTVWLGSDVGVFATDGANWWNTFDRTTGLPYEDVTCLAAADGQLWVGTTEGVCRYTGDGWQYYWGPRWLPHNRVNAITVDKDGAAWVATDGGVARLYDRETTLAEKAAHYQRTTDARHNRRGWVTGSRLKKPGDVNGGFIHEASDNDGLWTAVYVAAQSFRYAVTRETEARAAARKSMQAMLDLVRLSGYPGFPARAIIRRGEEVDGYSPDETVRVEGETDKIWFRSKVDPELLCKGDTSSDELDGHYFAWTVYHDLVADEEEKREIRAVVQAVTDNLLEHDLTLVGHTGRKTRWGIYHPRYINDDPLWWEERGLNALSILAYLKVAEHICGHRRYGEKRRELIEKYHYLLNTVSQKVAGPWHSVNHSDDQMAFMMYYASLRLEKDPATRLVLLQSLDRSWQIERPERSPFFNFVFGASTGRPCDTEEAVATLQEWPWELVEWESRGSHRHDVTVLTHSAEGRRHAQLTRALPASERRLMRWNGNPYQPDGGTREGRSEEDASAWLLPYWMGRYHGFIKE